MKTKQKSDQKAAVKTQPAAEIHMPLLIRDRWRVRQLIDGRWVAEERTGWWIFERWLAIDLKSPFFLWSPSDQFYAECVGTYEKAIAAIALRGVSW